MVRGEVALRQGLFGHRTCVVLAGVYPTLDAVAVVGDAGWESYWISHNLEGDRAKEVRWDLDLCH